MALCGVISQYNAPRPPPARATWRWPSASGCTLRGFIVGDHDDRQPEFVAEVGRLAGARQLKYRETVVEGIENALEAFLGVLRGDNTGKMLVRICKAALQGTTSGK